MNNCEKGRRAEDLAARFLRAKGYRIWKQNWRSGRKEIDLVAMDRDMLVIVEVKAMVNSRVNQPAEVVDEQKQRHIVWATEAFIRIHRCAYPTRFDVISVQYHARGVEVNHIEQAFVPLSG